MFHPGYAAQPEHLCFMPHSNAPETFPGWLRGKQPSPSPLHSSTGQGHGGHRFYQVFILLSGKYYWRGYPSHSLKSLVVNNVVQLLLGLAESLLGLSTLSAPRAHSSSGVSCPKDKSTFLFLSHWKFISHQSHRCALHSKPYKV